MQRGRRFGAGGIGTYGSLVGNGAPWENSLMSYNPFRLSPKLAEAYKAAAADVKPPNLKFERKAVGFVIGVINEMVTGEHFTEATANQIGERAWGTLQKAGISAKEAGFGDVTTAKGLSARVRSILVTERRLGGLQLDPAYDKPAEGKKPGTISNCPFFQGGPRTVPVGTCAIVD